MFCMTQGSSFDLKMYLYLVLQYVLYNNVVLVLAPSFLEPVKHLAKIYLDSGEKCGKEIDLQSKENDSQVVVTKETKKVTHFSIK